MHPISADVEGATPAIYPSPLTGAIFPIAIPTVQRWGPSRWLFAHVFYTVTVYHGLPKRAGG